MPVFSQESLSRRSCLFRYFHFIVSSVSVKSYLSWKSEGEPNPFVAPSYRRRVTHQIEILEIFDDYRRMPSRDLT